MGTPLAPKYIPYTYMDPLGLGFRILGLGCGVQVLGFGLRAGGSGLKVCGLRLRKDAPLLNQCGNPKEAHSKGLGFRLGTAPTQ